MCYISKANMKFRKSRLYMDHILAINSAQVSRERQKVVHLLLHMELLGIYYIIDSRRVLVDKLMIFGVSGHFWDGIEGFYRKV